MSGIAVTDHSRTEVVDGIKHGDKHIAHGIGGQQAVDLRHTGRNTLALQALGTDNSTADSHEQCCGNALATDVGNHQSNAVVVNAEEVVEVATNVLGGLHRCVDIHLIAHLREWGKDARQDILLNVAGRREVALQRLQLGVFLLRLVDEINLSNGLLDGQTQVVHIDGLRSEVEGTVVHRLANVFHIAVGTDHNDAQRRIAHLVHLGQQRQTIHLGHVDV